MKAPVRRHVAALIVGASWGLSAPAQAPSPSPQAVAVLPGVETELLRLEAVVIDRDGRPVTNLGPQDFVVLEDGQPQTLTHFQAATPGAAAPVPPDATLTTGSTVVPTPPEGRSIVLAVDDLHLTASSLLACKEALKRFVVEQITDEDQVAVVTTSGSIGLFQAFTRERAVLDRAIERLSYRERRAGNAGRATMSEREAEAIESGDKEALRLATQEISLRENLSIPMQNPRAEQEARSQARGMAGEMMDVTNRTLSTLEGVVRSLGSLPGRKLLVLVSDGFLGGEGTRDPGAFDPRRVFDASARAGVSVYALHSRGLTAGPPGGDASHPGQVEHSSLATRASYQSSGDVRERNSMSALAEGTGGFLVHGTNDLSLGLGRILRDSASAYLLAYSPGRTVRDGSFRAIEVKLPRHEGYTVRSRKGYFAADDRKPAAAVAAKGPAAQRQRDAGLRDALASLVPQRGVPVQLSVDFVDLPPEGLQLKVRGRFELAGVPFAREGERHRGDLDVLGVVYNEKGEVVGEVDSYHADLNLSASSYERLLREGLRYEKSLALKPGLYQVRLAAREATSALVGSASQWVQVPDLKAGPLALSSVFLFAEPATRAGDGTAADLADVQAARTFSPGGSLYFRLYAYNAARDPQGRTEVVLQSQVWSAGKLQGASPVEPVAFVDSTAAQPVSGRITLEGLAPGEYELRVLLVDRKANANVMRRVTFTVG